MDVVAPHYVQVRFESSRCNNCQCGRAFQTSASADGQELQVPFFDGLKKGQRILLSVGERAFSQIAILLFGLPLLLVFSGAGGAWLLGWTPSIQALTALLCGIAGWRFARWRSRRTQTTVYESLTMDIVDR